MRLRICLLFTRYPFALFKESHDLEDLGFSRYQRVALDMYTRFIEELKGERMFSL